jgi:hypothetical protein
MAGQSELYILRNSSVICSACNWRALVLMLADQTPGPCCKRGLGAAAHPQRREDGLYMAPYGVFR